MRIQIDVYAWIPQADVPNPLAALPGGTRQWGPGASGPVFGGDNFVTPPPFASAWTKTFRGQQSFAFAANRFGQPPTTILNPSVKPGVTTILTGPRKSGGHVCFSLQARVTASSSGVNWNSKEEQYEIRLHGEVQDPVPALTGKVVGGRVGGSMPAPVSGWSKNVGGTVGDSLASRTTPGLYWKLVLRIQHGTEIPFLQSAEYAGLALTCDDSARTFGPNTSLGGTRNLIHGYVDVSLFPSYVVYVTLENEGKVSVLPVFFSDASRRSLPEILVTVGSRVRELTW